MSLDQLLEEAGSFKALFASARKGGINVEEEMQKAMALDSDLFRTVGYEVVRLEEGAAELRFPYSSAVARRGGMVHGGIIMYSLDTACGIAVMTINEGFDQLTMELKVNFLEPLRNGPFTVTGRVVRPGRTVATAEGEVKDAVGTVCARSLGSWYMLPKRREKP